MEETNVSEGFIAVPKLDFGWLLESWFGCKDVLVIENLERVGDTVSSFN